MKQLLIILCFIPCFGYAQSRGHYIIGGGPNALDTGDAQSLFIKRNLRLIAMPNVLANRALSTDAQGNVIFRTFLTAIPQSISAVDISTYSLSVLGSNMGGFELRDDSATDSGVKTLQGPRRPGRLATTEDITDAVAAIPNTTAGLVVTNSFTLSLTYATDYVFTGATATFTLPTVSSSIKGRAQTITIKNRGSGSITLNAAGGLNTIYTTSAVNGFTINPGQAYTLLPDGTMINVE